MSFTWIAVILIPMGLYGFFRSPTFLYYALIFSLPFSATAVLNIGGADSASGVTAALFLGVLCLGRGVLSILFRPVSLIAKGLVVPNLFLVIFLCICGASLVMPLIIDGKLMITPILLTSTDTAPLYFSMKNVTALIYLGLGCGLTAYFSVSMSDPMVMANSIRMYVVSNVLVSVWGLMQWLLRILGLTYPSFIFNTSATLSAQGFNGALDDLGVPRISSVAVEPSLYAQVALTALVILVINTSLGSLLISKKMDRLCAWLIAVTLLLSTSTEALGGLVLIGLLYTSVRVHRKGLSIGLPIYAIGLIVVVSLAFVAVPVVNNVISNTILSKSDSYSGLERIRSVQLASEYFERYPVLGVGWGSITSHDLIVNIGASAGFLGLASFSAYIFTLVKRGLREFFRDEFEPLQLSIFAAFIVLLMMNILTGFTYVFYHVWFLFGAMTAATCSAVAGSYRIDYLSNAKQMSSDDQSELNRP